MLTRQHSTLRVQQLESASPVHRLPSLIIGCMLIAAAIWCGAALRSQAQGLRDAGAAAYPLEIVDSQRALIFKAEAATGDVRVLNVRSGVSEIARLHEAHRKNITGLSLDAQHAVLTVLSANERYQYDAHTFRLLTRNAVLAAGPNV
jgi:hypothetical protein